MKELIRKKINTNLIFNNTKNLVVGNESTNFNQDVKFNGNIIINTKDNKSYTLPNEGIGVYGDVLTSNGNGTTKWAPAGSAGSGITYKGVIPAPIGGILKILDVNGQTVDNSKMIETNDYLDMNNLTIEDINIIEPKEIHNQSGDDLKINTYDQDLNIKSHNINIDGYTSLSNLTQGTKIYNESGTYNLNSSELINIIDTLDATTLILPYDTNIHNGYTLTIINMGGYLITIIPDTTSMIENNMPFIKLTSKFDRIKLTFYNKIWIVL
jgi:hypothetical protein